MSAALRAEVHIIADRCRACGICIEACQSGVLEKAADGIPALRDAAACTGCGICQMLCPDFAIWVSIPTSEERV